MGISDDIVPQKKRRHLSHPILPDSFEVPAKKSLAIHKTEVVEESSNNKKPPEDESGDKKEALRDSFFRQDEKFVDQTRRDEDEEDETPKKKSGGHFAVWLLFILLFALIGTLAWQNLAQIKALFVKDTASDKTATTTNTSTPTYEGNTTAQDYTTAAPSTTTATPTTTTPPATTDSAPAKADYKVQVLNGNGIAGSAAAVKKTLVTAGFTVSSLTNARRFTYATTIIYFKTGKDAGAELVKTALTSRSVTTEKSDTIASTYDIVVVVGKL